jgi:hypothetical protein
MIQIAVNTKTELELKTNLVIEGGQLFLEKKLQFCPQLPQLKFPLSVS